MVSILPHVIAALLYAGLAVAFRLRRAPHPVATAAPGLLHHAVLVPLALQTWLLYRDVFSGPDMYMGVGTAISMIVWLTLLIYWTGSLLYRIEAMQFMVLPIAAVAVLLPLVLPPSKPMINAAMPAFRWHVVISMLAYSLFTIASLQALLMTVAETRLRSGVIAPAQGRLPPLLTMEKLLFRVIAAGFVLLTLSLGSGMLFSEELFGKPLQFSHKTVFGIASWLIFGGLLVGRWRWGWRGKVAMRWTLAGFGTLVLAYLGSKFVLEVILQR